MSDPAAFIGALAGGLVGGLVGSIRSIRKVADRAAEEAVKRHESRCIQHAPAKPNPYDEITAPYPLTD